MNTKLIKFLTFLYFSSITSNYAAEKDLLITFDLSNITKEKEINRKNINFVKYNKNVIILKKKISKNNLDDHLIFQFNKVGIKNANKFNIKKNCTNFLIHAFDNKELKNSIIPNLIFENKLVKTINYSKFKEKSFLSRLDYFRNSENIYFTFQKDENGNDIFFLEVYIEDVKSEKNHEYSYTLKIGSFFEDRIDKINIIYGENLFETENQLFFKKETTNKIKKINFFFKVNKNELDIFKRELKNINLDINIKKSLSNYNLIGNSENKNFLKLKLKNINLNIQDKSTAIYFENQICVNNLKNIFLVNIQSYPWYKYLNEQQIKNNIINALFSKDLNINDVIFEINNEHYKFKNLLLKNELYKNYYLNSNAFIFEKTNYNLSNFSEIQNFLGTSSLITNLNYFEIDKYNNLSQLKLSHKSHANNIFVYIVTTIIIIFYLLILYVIRLKKNETIYMKNFIILFSIVYFLIVLNFFSNKSNTFLIYSMLIILIFKIIFNKKFRNL